VWKDNTFHTSELKNKRTKRETKRRRNKNKKRGVIRTWEPAVVVCERIRKASFHICCSQIGTGTCDGKVRGMQKKTERNKREKQNPTGRQPGTSVWRHPAQWSHPGTTPQTPRSWKMCPLLYFLV
jgi:hypothetical protein